MNDLAVNFMNSGRMKEAEPLLRPVVEAKRKNEPDVPDTLIAARQIIVELFPTDHRRGSRFPSRQLIVEILRDPGTVYPSEVFPSATCCA
jgi:hypothetical protein